MNEACLKCMWCEIIENGATGFLGETVLKCFMCEEDTVDKTACFTKIPN